VKVNSAYCWLLLYGHKKNVQDDFGFMMLVAMNVSNRHVTFTIDVGNPDSIWFP